MISIDDPIEWITSEFFIPETRGPIVLYPHQIATLREAYARDENGHYKYSVVVWSDIKKSAKSTIAGAVVLERARNLYHGSIKIVANDIKQADSRVAYYARRAIELNPRLAEITRIRMYSTEFIPNHTKIEAIPVDPKGEAGGNDDLIVFSELWAANQKSAQRMWTEMTLSPTKYGYSQRWVETYAGFEGESPLLEQLYNAGVKEGVQLDLSYDGHDLSDLEVFANPSARLLCLWNTKPRLPWQTKAYYAQEEAVLQANEYKRVHRNSWVSSTKQFVPMEWWYACEVKPLPTMSKFREIVVSLDAGVTDDCFAMIGVSREGDSTTVRYSRAWYPPKGGKIEFSGADPNDLEYPEGELRRLAKEYNVIVFTYDPYQLEDFARRMTNAGLGFFDPFPQGAPRLVADKELYDAIRNRTLKHSGEAELTAHINNANSTTEDKDTLRIIKRALALKIDLAVALSMARAKAMEYLPG